VYRTEDGGQSWNRLLGGQPTTDIYFGVPVTTGRGVKLPRIVGHSDGSQDISIWISSDLGAHFTAPHSAPLHVPSTAGNLTVTIQGNDVWVPATGRIYESTDGGQSSWIARRTATAVDRVSLAGGDRAIGQASADCSSSSNTEQCLSSSYLIATDDSGRNWHTM
jgi:photosystem II stability/assembly factor-like uncharacterized protein